MKMFRSGPMAVGAFILVIGFVFFAAWWRDPGHVSEEGDATAALPPISSDPSETPVIDITDHLNLGQVPNDKPSVHPLRVANKGKAPLVINDISTSCACTTGKIDPVKRTIPPGGEATIEVTLDPFRVPGFHSKKMLTVFSNDLKHSSFEVIVESDIQPEFEVVPPEVDFGVVAKGETPEKTLRVRQLQDAPVEIQDIALNVHATPRSKEHNDLTATVAKCPEDQWKTPGKVEYEVKIQIRPEAHPGTQERAIYLQSNLSRLPMFHVPVKAQVTAPYTVSTAEVPLRPSPAGLYEGKVSVKSTEPFTVEGVTTDPGLTTKLIGPQDGTILIDVSAPMAQVQDEMEGYVLYSVKIAGGTYTDYARLTAKELKALPPKAQ
jgi:hypothetical protein